MCCFQTQKPLSESREVLIRTGFLKGSKITDSLNVDTEEPGHTSTFLTSCPVGACPGSDKTICVGMGAPERPSLKMAFHIYVTPRECA